MAMADFGSEEVRWRCGSGESAEAASVGEAPPAAAAAGRVGWVWKIWRHRVHRSRNAVGESGALSTSPQPGHFHVAISVPSP